MNKLKVQRNLSNVCQANLENLGFIVRQLLKTLDEKEILATVQKNLNKNPSKQVRNTK